LFCSSITDCANKLARLEGRFSVASVALPPVVEAGAPNKGTGTDDVVVAAGVEDAGASFFSAGGPKLNAAKGEAFAGALPLDGNVGVNPAGAAVCGVLLELGVGSLNPPTAGRAGFALSDAGSEGLNPLAVEDDVDDAGAGSLNPPALGIATAGTGIAAGGLLVSAFLCGGSILEVSSSNAVASRFFPCASAPLTDGTLFPAFFVISSR
jgi:hypothetical protein